jgi:hypothetical protein
MNTLLPPFVSLFFKEIDGARMVAGPWGADQLNKAETTLLPLF